MSAVAVLFQKSLPSPKIRKIFSTDSSRRFMDLFFTCTSMIQLEVFLMNGVRQDSGFILFHTDIQLSWYHLLVEKAVLSLVQCSAIQLQCKSTNLTHMGLFLDSALFHWTICLSLCQYLLIYYVEVCSFLTHFIENF